MEDAHLFVNIVNQNLHDAPVELLIQKSSGSILSCLNINFH